MIDGRYVSWCARVPRFATAPPNRPQCTPALTSSDRSPWPSISNAVTERADVVGAARTPPGSPLWRGRSRPAAASGRRPGRGAPRGRAARWRAAAARRRARCGRRSLTWAQRPSRTVRRASAVVVVTRVLRGSGQGGGEAVPGEVDEVLDDAPDAVRERGESSQCVGGGADDADQGVAPGGGAVGRCPGGGEGLADLLRHQLTRPRTGSVPSGDWPPVEQGPLDDEPVDLRVALDEGEVGVDRRRDGAAARRRGGRRARRWPRRSCGDQAVDRLGDGQVELALVAEVPVEHGLGGAGDGGDLVHARRPTRAGAPRAAWPRPGTAGARRGGRPSAVATVPGVATGRGEFM